MLLPLIAFRNLVHHRRRTLLLGGALSAITAVLVVMLSLVSGIETAMNDSFTGLFTGHVNVEGFYKLTPSRAQPVVTEAAQLRQLVKENVPELDVVVSRGRGWMRVIGQRTSLQLGVTGVDVAEDARLRAVVHPVAGSLEALEQPDTLLLFDVQAEKLGVTVGDSVILSAPALNGAHNTLDVRVVAVAKSVGALSGVIAFASNDTVRKLYALSDDTTGALHLYLKNPADASSVHERLRQLLPKHGFSLMEHDPRLYFDKTEKVLAEEWRGQKVDLTTSEDLISSFDWATDVLVLLASSLTGILLIIVLVGVTNTLWLAIHERTREIGTLRAIGMRSDQTLRMFVWEALILALLGTASGALIGAAIAGGITAADIAVPRSVGTVLMRDTLLLRTEPSSLIGPVLLITLFTSLVAVVPSLKAARLKPATAMRQVE